MINIYNIIINKNIINNKIINILQKLLIFYKNSIFLISCIV